MQQMNLGAVDLNLLVALRALLEERHVTRAARRVGLSQPAMSHALARLRELFDDPLLVRTKRGMQPTPRAEEIAPALARALEDLGRIVAPPERFEPTRSKRCFTLVSDDYSELVVLPKVLARAWKEAPNIQLRVRPIHARWNDDLVEGRVDFALVPARTGPALRDVVVQKMFHEDFVLVVRADHPHVKKKLTLAEYLALPHALIAPRGEGGSVVDTALGRLGGRSRRVAVEVPHFLVAPFVVRETDVVLMLAERIAKAMANALDLRVLAPPDELGLNGFDIYLAWHGRQRNDAAHAWMRGVIQEVTKRV